MASASPTPQLGQRLSSAVLPEQEARQGPEGRKEGMDAGSGSVGASLLVSQPWGSSL